MTIAEDYTRLQAYEEFVDFIISLEADNPQARRNITLTEIIARARKAKEGKRYG